MTQRKPPLRRTAPSPRRPASPVVDPLRTLAAFSTRHFATSAEAVTAALAVLHELNPSRVGFLARALPAEEAGGMDTWDVVQLRSPGEDDARAHTIVDDFLRRHTLTRHASAAPIVSTDETTGTTLVAPLVASDGQIWGWLGTIAPTTFAATHLDAVQLLAQLVMQRIEFDAIRQAATNQQTQLHAAELEAIFNAITDSIFFYTPDGQIREMNQAARDLLGLDKEPQHMARPPAERTARYKMRDEEGNLLPFEQWPVTRILSGEQLTGSNVAEFVMDTLDGRMLTLSFGGAPIVDATGAIIGGVGVCRDISARRRMERDAEAQARELETMLMTLSDALFIHDHDGHLVRINPAGQALLGTPQTPTGEMYDRAARWNLRDAEGRIMTPDEWPLARVLRGERFAGESAVDVRMDNAAGTARIISFSGAPIRAADGTVTGSVTLAHDVTTRRQLERRTQMAFEALLEMATALARMPDGTAYHWHDLQRVVTLTQQVLAGQSTSIVRVNMRSGHVTPEAAVGMTPEIEARWWQTLHTAQAEAYLPQEDLARLQAGEALLIDLVGAPPIPGQDYFGIRTVLAVAAPLANGDLCILVIEARDHAVFAPADIGMARAAVQLATLVIERERLLRETTAAQAREMALQTTNDQMLAFLGIAGHELRTPVTSLKGSAQLAARTVTKTLQLDLPPAAITLLMRARDIFATVDRQVEKLNALIAELLDITRIQAGKLELHPARTDVGALTRAVAEEQQFAWPDRPITLDLPVRPITIVCDADRVEQVVSNFITNALKYSAEDQPITITVQPRGESVRVAVTDHGPGISAEAQASLWQLFQQVPGIQQQSGSGIGLGIGLYLCRTIIDRHGGQVGIESQVGQGSTFWFSLPITEALP